MLFHPNQIKGLQARGASVMLRARVAIRHGQRRRSRALHGGRKAQSGHGRQTSGADQSCVQFLVLAELIIYPGNVQMFGLELDHELS
jgi:hypothetical protein